MKYSMHKLFILAFALPLGLVGQEVVLDSAEVVNAEVVEQGADLDSAAMALIDARLALLDSEHLFFNMANVPSPADSAAALPLTDSIFAHYMAELDARTPFEMAYNPVVKRYMERYLKHGSARLSRMMAHGQYYFPMFEEH
ncbi:MAG: hypothetical protein EBZ22_09260, partial [Flavobacteriia bacterium]|nr:hypothetical protein [Flavobacteriia bacterium]